MQLSQRTNKAVVLTSYPEGIPNPKSDFRVEDSPLRELQDGEVLAKTLYVSVDPYMRVRMRPDTGGYFPPFPLNEPVPGGGVGQIIQSKDNSWKPGDIFIASLEWRNYNIIKPCEGKEGLYPMQKLENWKFPLSTAIGVLGMPGMTAYFGLLEITNPKEGETLVVSGAAGAVGSLVGQIGKIRGCHVVGIAGSEEKIEKLKEFGFDSGINYKTTPDMSAAIARHCPKGVDIYFDNVGGDITDAVMEHINQFGRVSVCGSISKYNSTEPDLGPRDNWILISKNVKKEGFLVSRWVSRWFEGIQQMGQWIIEDKIQFEETIREGLENIPVAFVEMLTGRNIGKMIVKCGDVESF